MSKNDTVNERNFWVVSPNVDGDYHTVKQWRREIIRHRAAFMGWPPKNKRNRIGSRFAYKIKSGDVILIARRWRHEPDIVGFGIVRGKLKTQLPSFKPPGGKLGSLWKAFLFFKKTSAAFFRRQECFGTHLCATKNTQA